MRRYTCSRTELINLLPRILTFCCLYTFITSSVGRKQLSSLDLTSYRQPLYESTSNSQQSNVGTESHTPILEYLDPYNRLNSPYHSLIEHQPKYSYVINRKPGNGKLYRIPDQKQTTQNSRDTKFLPPLHHEAYHGPTIPKLDSDPHITKKGGKSYEFAYAVHPKDEHTSVGTDFNLSHKESRDGKRTMGEYKVLLPDGRLQIVRYTADGKEGFKADVTYEADRTPQQHSHEQIYTQPKQITKPNHDSPHHDHHDHHHTPLPPLNPPAFKSRSFSSTGDRVHPSLSPSIYYQPFSVNIHEHHLNQHSALPAPTPSLPQTRSIFKVASALPTINTISSPPGYHNLKRAIFGPTFLPTPSTTPKSIYDKIHNIPYDQTAHYAPVSWGQRAGPVTLSTAPPVTYKSQHDFVPKQKQFTTPTYSVQQHLKQKQTPAFPSSFGSYEDRPIFPKSEHDSFLPKNKPFSSGFSKSSRLLPSFSAGPNRLSSLIQTNPTLLQNPRPFTLQNEHGEHFILEEVKDHESQSPIISKYPPLSTKPKNNDGDLLYFQTPPIGGRPTPLKINDDEKPHDRLPRPKTFTHPYQVGVSDYGQSVGYSTTGGSGGTLAYKTFRASQQIPAYIQHDHHSGAHHLLGAEESRIYPSNNVTVKA